MTDKIDKDEQPSVGRRKLLKRAAVALPVVVTIPSGAALARSSNFIGYMTAGQGGDGGYNGYIRCLSNGAVAEWEPGAQLAHIDGALAPSDGINVSTANEYRQSGVTYSAAGTCMKGGEFTIKGTTKKAYINKGVMVSLHALNSFGVDFYTANFR